MLKLKLGGVLRIEISQQQILFVLNGRLQAPFTTDLKTIVDQCIYGCDWKIRSLYAMKFFFSYTVHNVSFFPYLPWSQFIYFCPLSRCFYPCITSPLCKFPPLHLLWSTFNQVSSVLFFQPVSPSSCLPSHSSPPLPTHPSYP